MQVIRQINTKILHYRNISKDIVTKRNGMLKIIWSVKSDFDIISGNINKKVTDKVNE